MIICAQYFWYYLKKFKEKERIVLYGGKEKTKRLAKLTKTAGYEVAYIVGDEEDETIKSCFDLLYEDYSKLFVWIVSDDHIKYVNRLREFGLKEHENFASITRPPYMNLDERFILDVHLGYTSNTQGKYSGVTVYGNDTVVENKQLKIVTLGGSTSDSIAYPWKSWSELLYERLTEKYNDRNIIIYSAGVCAYSSSQELIKLQRDLIKLNPDIVLSYSGLNDSVLENDLWTTPYQRMIFDKIALNERFTINGGASEYGYSVGISKGIAPVDCFISNMKMMHATCSAFGIRFYGFLQAMMGEELYVPKTDEEELIRNDMDNVYANTKEFLREAKKKIADLDYLYDLSSIFNISQKVYIDTEHVNEIGNGIIADAIMERVEWCSSEIK